MLEKRIVRDFTFVVFTFNQEKYVVQHLESIRYQIENYGKDYEIHLKLCDDASVDRTVELVKKWVSEHNFLFTSVEYIVQKKNSGIVNNFITGLKNVHTKYFKILAGDDIYYKNNIFEAIVNGNFLISPLLEFNEKLTVRKLNHIYYDMFLYRQHYKKNLVEFIMRYLKYTNVIAAPGVFFCKEFNVEKIERMFSKYSFIEDYPLWNYLFSEEKIDMCVWEVPLVMYRGDVGISNNELHPMRIELLKDWCIIEKEIRTDYHFLPKVINPFKYRHSIFKRLHRYIYSNDCYIKKVNKDITRSEHEASQYLKYIIDCSDRWMQNNRF